MNKESLLLLSKLSKQINKLEGFELKECGINVSEISEIVTTFNHAFQLSCKLIRESVLEIDPDRLSSAYYIFDHKTLEVGIDLGLIDRLIWVRIYRMHKELNSEQYIGGDTTIETKEDCELILRTFIEEFKRLEISVTKRFGMI